jgi:hypothetical protein
MTGNITEMLMVHDPLLWLMGSVNFEHLYFCPVPRQARQTPDSWHAVQGVRYVSTVP